MALSKARNAVRRLLRDCRGTYLIEFALLAPVLAILVVGFFDIGHTLYMRSVLQGIVQKTSRDSGLEDGTTTANQALLDAKVRDGVHELAKSATVGITRRFYRSFSKAAAAQAEPFTDGNANGQCDNSEPFEDQNSNGVRDSDGADEGQGGAKDSVLYTVTVTYPRMFPLHNFIGVSPTSTVKAATILNNQPYGEQGSDTPTVRQCPA